MVMELIAFLLLVGIISLSGVMMPGPVFAAAIAKGTEHRHAGAWIALGHLIIEVPMIIALATGLSFVFENIWVKLLIGFAGGGLLLYIGYQMIRLRDDLEVVKKTFPSHSITAGIVTTVSNPYFILWWATIGVFLIITALGFGWVGILLFIIVHESCDIGWDWSVSYIVNKSKKFWTKNVHKYVFGICGFFLLVLGGYFLLAFMLVD
jgi:threonine/homoserine/homoserine lactone efflux protein